MNKLGLTLVSAACFGLFSCDEELHVTTKLNNDGSLDRIVAIADKDSSAFDNNIFGIKADDGWQAESKVLYDTSDQVYTVLARHFPSVEDVNRAMNVPSDTLWQIESRLESRFRWFFTYYRYSDTYSAINRFRHPDINDYFTPEDIAFIDRVDDGKVTKADSLFLEYIGDKIFEGYTAEAWMSEIEQTIFSVLDDVGLPAMKKTIDVRQLFDDDNEMFNDDLDEIVPIARELGVPIDTLDIATRLEELYLDVEQRINFMGDATNIELIHSIEVPGLIINTNAMQVDSKTATWSPRIIKFCLQPYTMYAEYRTMNWWAIVVSAIIVLGSLVLFFRPRA
jgi:hypothetical protein